MTGATIEWPCQTNLTGVPQGSVLLATPIVEGRSVCPQAVERPHMLVPPYQLAPAMRNGVKVSSASLKAVTVSVASVASAVSAGTGAALAAPPVAAWAPGATAKANAARAPASSAARSQSAVCPRPGATEGLVIRAWRLGAWFMSLSRRLRG